MDRTVRMALARGVDVGAHVGFPDRRASAAAPMQIETARARRHVIYQLGALAGIARAAGPPHDAHELSRRARQHGGGRRGAGRAAGARGGGLRPGADRQLVGSRAIEDAAARCGLRVAHHLPGRPRLRRRRACWCRASCPDSVIHDARRGAGARAPAAGGGHRHRATAAARSADAACARSWCTATRRARWRWRAHVRGVVEAGGRPRRADLAAAWC